MGATREAVLSRNETNPKTRASVIAALSKHVDLVGPAVEDDIRRAINRYGADAVQLTVAKLTKRKRGAPKMNDWVELGPVIEAEAMDWLAGRDPIAARSNYNIAKEFADKNPGHSHPSTMKRIKRKLSKKPHGRHWYILAFAYEKSKDGYPYGIHLRALEELHKIDEHGFWDGLLDLANCDLQDYEAKIGKGPPTDLSMKEIQDVARKPVPVVNAMLAAADPNSAGMAGGLLGSFKRNNAAET
jgi:hypothetical protein